MELVGARSGAVYFLDTGTETLRPRVSVNAPDWIPEVRLALGEGVAGVAAQRRQGVVVNDYKTWPLAVRRIAEETPITALMAEPLLYHDRLLGVILVSHETPGRTFTEADRETLALFATPAAIAITNARLFGERLTAEQAARETARRLATLVSNLPGYTYRVADDPDYTAEFISEGVVTITGYGGVSRHARDGVRARDPPRRRRGRVGPRPAGRGGARTIPVLVSDTYQER